MSTIRKLYDLLNFNERKQTKLLLSMIIVMALLDMLGVASVMPFMAVAANPNLIETNFFLSFAYDYLQNFGIISKDQFLFFLGFSMLFILIFSLMFKALTTFVQLRFTLMREYTIGRRLVEGYLHQPYEWFLHRHSADLGKNILSEVGVVIGSVLLPILTIISQGAVSIALFILIIIADPYLALSISAILIISYLLVFGLLKSRLSRIGLERAQSNEARYTALNEAFGATKEVKIGRLEQTYLNRFSKPAKIYATSHASASVMGQIPRYFLEAVAFGGMIVLVLVLMSRSNGFANSIPILVLYAFAGYRLMPALQQIYISFTQVRFGIPSLNILHNDLIKLKEYQQIHNNDIMSLNKNLSLKNIYFNYPKTNHRALENFSLSISAFSRIGIVGVTGSGKTTAVDLIMGLLEAQNGSLEVDGVIINKSNVHSWQKSIGYVPQQIFLSDDTIASNIAFGVDKLNINMSQVESAAKISNLHEFIIDELPENYNSKVGERGVRLSGGQRQRIGIARALYHQPQVLILDEATSALDNMTEKAVMEAMDNLGRNITIILIAHRLNTVKNCDKIFIMEKGKIESQGTYNELNKSSKIFQKLINLD